MFCEKCGKRTTCKRICFSLEKELTRGTHSLKSNYFIKFVDPRILGEMNSNPFVYKRKRKTQLLKHLEIMLEVLTDAEKSCILRYYALHGHSFMTQAQIGQELGFSQNYVKYHIQRARVKIRKALTDRKLIKIYNLLEEEESDKISS